MKKSLLSILILLSLFFGLGNKQAKATHVLGVDFSWRCLTNDTYEIKVVVYRRCTDGAATLSLPSTPATFVSDSCAVKDSFGLGTVQSYRIEDITPVCKPSLRPCTSAGGSGVSNAQVPIGIERHTVTYKIYLGSSRGNCCWYRIRWQLCCRNSNINTGLADADFYADAWLNRCIAPKSNSPEFLNPPIMIGFVGQDILYNNGAYDYDGDSLSYEMAQPLGATFTSPWSYTYPLTCNGGNVPNPNVNPPTGFNLNRSNGDIIFRPAAVQVSAFKVMVTEWRKDSTGKYKVIGKTGRDVQLNIIASNNIPPKLSGPFSYDVCAGEQLCFTINTSDSDATDTTRIFWNRGIAAASWMDNNGSTTRASGTFCWTPSINDTSTAPYYFTAAVNDDHCPILGKAFRTYSVRVLNTPQITRTFNKISCSLLEMKATPKNNSFGSANFKWYVPVLVGTGTPTTVFATTAICQYQFTAGGKYVIKSTISNGGCEIAYIDTIIIDNNILSHIVALGDTILCPGNATVLVADSAINYQWYNDTTLINGATAKSYSATKAGRYRVKTTNATCNNQSNIITIYEITNPVINKSIPVCTGDTIRYAVNGKTGATFQWYKDGTSITGETNSNLKVTLNGVYYCRVVESGCVMQSNTDTAIFLALPAKPTITLTGNKLVSSAGFSYQWYNDTTKINGETANSYTPSNSGIYRVKVTGSNGCFSFSNPFNYIVGIATASLKSKINISPNPFNDQVQIQINDYSKPLAIVLYDMLGKPVLQTISATTPVVLNTSRLSYGIYILEIADGEHKVVMKLEKR